MDSLDILDEALKHPSVIIDENKLSTEYLPKQLPFREEQLKKMANYLGGIFTGQLGTKQIIITGNVGSGKTSIAKKFGQWLQLKSEEKKENKIKFIHINCRRTKTPFMILLSVARELNSKVASRGYAADELLEMIVEILENKRLTLVLVLDEIEHVIHKGGKELLYALSRTSDDKQKTKHQLILLVIARSSRFIKYLDKSTTSSLRAPIISCPPYSKEELISIIQNRLDECFRPGSVTDETTQLIADIAEIRGGDARHALELLLIAGKIADSENSKIVYPEHARKAKANVDPSLLRETLQELSIHKILLLYGITQRLRKTKGAYITTGDAEEAYKIAAEEIEIEPRQHTQVWEYIQELEFLEIIAAEKSGLGHRGNTKLISIQDTSALELEQELLKKLQQILQKYKES